MKQAGVVEGASITSLDVVGQRVRPLVTGERTGGDVEIFEISGDEGAGPPPHHHPWDELYVVLDGRLDVLVGEAWHAAGPGDSVNLPGGTVHAFTVSSPVARFLAVTVKAGAADYFAEMAANVRSMPADLPALLEISERHQVVSVRS